MRPELGSRPSLLAAMGLALLAGCAPADDSGGDRLGPLVEGTLLFEERVPTDDGLSAELFVRPARRVRIDALDAAGGLMVTSYSDESGGFAAPAAAAMVQAVSATREPSRIAVVDSAGALHRQVFPFGEAGATYTVPAADEQQTAGAFHILDVAERVADLVTEATGRPPHALRLTWQLGNTGTLALGLPVNASYYRRDPADPVIVLQGGEAGRVATTMTSHFDDAVIAHELGHFIMDTYSYDASLGGGHNANNLYFTLALSEGFATWLGSVALDDSVYISTTGQPPTPQLNFANYDIENVDNIPRRAFGNDSELTVSEVLWDLYDGSPEHAEDRDRDGVGLPFAEIFAAFTTVERERDYPYLTSILQKLEASGSLTRAQIQALLTSPVDQRVPYPPEVEWPFSAELDHAYQMELGLPEGLELDPSLWDGSVFLNQFWRFDLQERRSVQVTLDVDPFDLDPPLTLSLLTNANAAVKQAAGPPYPIELEAGALDPGRYVLKVSGTQHAEYTLQVEGD